MEKIAVCGKGGSGKSVLTTLLSVGLNGIGKQVLTIDADESNTGLFRLLGFSDPPEPLIEFMGGKNRIEKKFTEDIKSGIPEHLIRLMNREITIQDIPDPFLIQNKTTSLVCVGKIMTALEGCACTIGAVCRSFLKELKLRSDEVAVIDMEAGVEHFGRGVETGVDAVLVVVEPSMDSLDVAELVGKMSRQIDIGDVWAVLNKITSEKIAEELREELHKRGLSVIGSIRSDPEIALSCLRGQPLSGPMAEADVARLLDFLFP